MIICVHIYNVLKVKNAKSHLPPTKNTKYLAVSPFFAVFASELFNYQVLAREDIIGRETAHEECDIQ